MTPKDGPQRQGRLMAAIGKQIGEQNLSALKTVADAVPAQPPRCHQILTRGGIERAKKYKA